MTIPQYFAFGTGIGFGAAAFIVAASELISISLAVAAKKWDEPLCDGDHENMDCTEDDGFITCHFSGPIKGIA